MIEKMNKYLFMTYHKEYADFLRQLRTLGVVHIKECKDTRQIEKLQSFLAKRKEIMELFRRLKSRRDKNAPEIVSLTPKDDTAGATVRKEIEGLLDWEQQLANQIDSSRREIEYWQTWGDFDLIGLERLRSSGYPVRFFVSPTAAYRADWEERYGAVVINTFRAHNYFLTVGAFADKGPEADEVKVPSYTIEEMKSRLQTIVKEYEETRSKIVDFATNRLGELQGYAELMGKDYAFTNALLQAVDEADNTLKVVEGWVPLRDADNLEEALKGAPVYVDKLEILGEDNVPVKLRNNAYTRLFESITNMYSPPNYGEIDITGMFAPFFMLFFAMCFGDGGYGLLLFIGATFANIRAKDQTIKDVASMMQWLGAAAAVVGSLMGTVFGMVMPWAGDEGVLGNIRKDYFLNQDNLMYISIAIGLVQIIFGKFVAGIKITKQKGFKHALATFAWGVVILAGILGLVSPKLAAIPPIVSYIFYGIAAFAFLITLFYNMPGKNPLINFGAGLWNTYNTASGLLGDTLSYIRLFAIGLTGGILGGVFNTLAIQVSSGLPVGLNFLVMTIILLFGHGLNFGLCMISSLVHPLRLTFVEFYKNAGFEGGGRPYNPLR